MNMFTDSHFKSYSALLYNRTGIYFGENKKTLLEGKLKKAMYNMNFDSFDEYYNILLKTNKHSDFQELINCVTTNTTEFFREKEHFDYIKKNINYILEVNNRIKKNGEIRIWCSASSTGQEPVTIAMVLKEVLGKTVDIKILATDIDTKVLEKAMSGCYAIRDCKNIPSYYLSSYFECDMKENYVVKKEILKMIRYRQFNLMEEFKFFMGFDIIFCRNVMIYFNINTQQKLIEKFYDNLIEGGLLFIGHSESLFNKIHKFNYSGPSIFIKG